MQHRFLIAALWLLLPHSVVAQEKKPFLPPAPPAHPDLLGQGIQRTMTLLATSTPQRRNHVRILFYGQSITEQQWSKQVADDLRKRFPSADLEIENRAIGGFASQLLVRPAEHDLYPFYPDLLIFHVYGANNTYEEIIRNVRTRTTAEVLMQKDHVTQWPPDKPDRNADKGMWWDDMMNNVFLPDIAKKYGCALIDVRSDWLRYLRENQLQPKDLLKDGVHLNDHGNDLMAHLISRYLVYRPELPFEKTVKTLSVGKDLNWQGDSLKLEFEGNRVDLLPGAQAKGNARVLIDGRRPSEFPSAYRITRPSPGPWATGVALTRVNHDKPLIVEDWTLRVLDVREPDAGAKGSKRTFTYEVTGSKTGPDGKGDSGKPFTSTSGRVMIDPEAFFFGFDKPIAPRETITWKVLPMFQDEIELGGNFSAEKENAITLIQGIGNAHHTLEIISSAGPLPVTAIRIYTPPVK